MASIKQHLADLGVKKSAVKELVSLGPPAIIPLIRIMMAQETDYDEELESARKDAAFDALNKITKVHPEAVIELLTHASPAVRSGAVFVLGYSRGALAAPALIPLLPKATARFYAEIILALGNTRYKSALEPVLLALTNKNAAIRQAAAVALRAGVGKVR